MKQPSVAARALGNGFEPKRQVDQYHSVEFSVRGCEFIYQFKIRDLSPKEKGILVKEGSDLLNHVRAGDVLNLKYYTPDLSTEYLKTEVRHIGKAAEGRFKGVYLVELSIVEN